MRKIISYFDKYKIIMSGILGFLLFFSLIVAAKIISAFVIKTYHFSIEIEDVFFAALGFFVVVIVRAVERFSN